MLNVSIFFASSIAITDLLICLKSGKGTCYYNENKVGMLRYTVDHDITPLKGEAISDYWDDTYLWMAVPDADFIGTGRCAFKPFPVL